MGIIRDFEKRIKEAGETREFYTGVIYCYTNMINGKKYIGQTFLEKVRKQQHKSTNGQSVFHKAIKKYGWENFKYEVLYKHDYLNYEVLNNNLDIMEMYYISKYDTYKKGYNLNNGASDFSKETREKLSNALKGKPHSEEHNRKVGLANKGKRPSQKCINFLKEYAKTHSPWNKGKKWNEEAKRKMSESAKGRTPWNKGVPMTEEQKQKLLLANIGRKQTEESIKKRIETLTENGYYKKISKQVVQLTLDGEYIKTFPSINAAAKSLNKLMGNIQQCCKGKRNFAYGYKWKYLVDYEAENCK